MSSIDFSIPNQILLWNNHSIVITGGKAGIYLFQGNCIISNHINHRFSWFKNTSEVWGQDYDYRLLSTLPSILNFDIYDNERY